jgi:para-aminobenzoate synthetase/4-amino-4-deoxychorismate lyase
LEVAQNSGFDDAIRLNGKGEVGETSIANLVLKVQGKWITPPVNAGILPGIIRALAVDLLSIEERTISSKDLFRVESIFLLNSLKGFQPVAFLEDRALVIDTEMMEKVATLSQFNSVG